MFVQLDAEAKNSGKSLFASNWIAGGEPVFTGYRAGCFFFQDVPVLSLAGPIWAAQFAATADAVRKGQIASLVLLCGARPFGYDPVQEVTIQLDGALSYQFNRRGNNDLSPAAIARQEVSGFDVWNPADITPTGPRGFDPANPWSWKVPGKKMSVFDLPAIASKTQGL